MYYNNKFKILNIALSIIIIISAIISALKPNLRIMPIILILLGVQQLLMAVNSFKLNKKKEFILSIGVSIFIFLCSITSMVLMTS